MGIYKNFVVIITGGNKYFEDSFKIIFNNTKGQGALFDKRWSIFKSLYIVYIQYELKTY